MAETFQGPDVGPSLKRSSSTVFSWPTAILTPLVTNTPPSELVTVTSSLKTGAELKYGFIPSGSHGSWSAAAALFDHTRCTRLAIPGGRIHAPGRPAHTSPSSPPPESSQPRLSVSSSTNAGRC